MKRLEIENIDDKTYQGLIEIQSLMKQTSKMNLTLEQIAGAILNDKVKLVLAHYRVISKKEK